MLSSFPEVSLINTRQRFAFTVIKYTFGDVITRVFSFTLFLSVSARAEKESAADVPDGTLGGHLLSFPLNWIVLAPGGTRMLQELDQ